jgi:hypothetical protein
MFQIRCDQALLSLQLKGLIIKKTPLSDQSDTHVSSTTTRMH